MATKSEVMSALDEFAQKMTDAITDIGNVKNRLTRLRTEVSNLPSDYSDELTEINGYVPTGAVEELAVQMKADYATDRTSLLARIDAVLAEFTTQSF